MNKKYFVFIAAAVLIIAAAAISSCKKDKEPEKPKTVKVDTQTGTMRAGQPDAVTFAVTTENIGNGEYDASMANMPAGVNVQGKVTIASGSGTLTLVGSTATVAGAFSSLKLTLGGVTSKEFTLTIGDAINLTVNVEEIIFPILESAAEKTFDITCNTAWSIDIGSGSAWCDASKTSGASTGTGKEIIRLTTKSANSSYEDRKFTLKVTAGSIVRSINVIQPYDPGNGTPARPYKVYDVATLQKIGSNAEWSLARTYRQMADINLEEVDSWTPIGTLANRFTGTYHGDGYTISNLKINTTGDYKGLFGFIGTLGMVRNIALTNVDITDGNNFIGGIAGASEGIIQNCYVTGAVNGNSLVGGVTGVVTSNANAKVENCYTTCNITSPATAGESYTGGIVGGIELGGVIQNCYATGNVINNRAGGGGLFLRAGGVVGRCVAPSKLVNSVALNKEVRVATVTTNSLAGRVGGSLPSDPVTEYNNCYGREGMLLTIGIVNVPINSSTSSMSGFNLTPAIYNVASNWSDGAKFPTAQWSFADNRLPHLKTTDGGEFKNPQNPTVTP